MKLSIFLFILCFLASCQKEEPIMDDPIDPSYYPPSDNDNWATISADSLGWNTSELDPLYDFLQENNTRAFIILQDGKVAIEEYWGEKITTLGEFDKDSYWYWASAGKTITGTAIGIAQEEGFLDINNPTSDYLGKQWTSMDEEKEILITVKNQLSMTTGLDFSLENSDCTLPECLLYKTDAGEQWYYHNAPYNLLRKVVTGAVGKDFEDYTNEKLLAPLNINGVWNENGYNKVFYTIAKDAARFGLLVLREGIWNEDQIIPTSFYQEMVNTSQTLNPSYGYLWWLNGKSSIRIPGIDLSINVPLSENAPMDLFAAMGKNGQFIDIVPSKNMVVIRMGQAPDESLVPVTFHDEMWGLINSIID